MLDVIDPSFKKISYTVPVYIVSPRAKNGLNIAFSFIPSAIKYCCNCCNSFIPSVTSGLLKASLKSAIVSFRQDKTVLHIVSAISSEIPRSNTSFRTPSIPIFSILSNDKMTSLVRSVGMLIDSRIPFNNFRLLYWIVTSKFNVRNSSNAMLISSASAMTDSTPTISTSHCINSRNLPCLIGPSRNTFPISYRLKGRRMFGFIATTFANGIVKS